MSRITRLIGRSLVLTSMKFSLAYRFSVPSPADHPLSSRRQSDDHLARYFAWLERSWRDYFLEEIVSQQNEAENDRDYWMLYWAPTINARILGPDHRDTLDAIDHSKTRSKKGHSPILLKSS